MTIFSDKAVLAGTKKREDGSLLADVRIARTGIQLYRGSEVDPENQFGYRDRAVVRVYRPGSEVFSENTLKSAAHRPVTNDHPSDGSLVDAENWKDHAVGNTADEVTAEGIYIRVPLMVSDAATIQDIENGKREVSAGYTSDLSFESGKTQDGAEYDAIQKNIRINHVAIVQHGRAGSKVRIGDSAGGWGAEPLNSNEGEVHMPDIKTRQVTVDGLTIETTDQGAQVIEKLQGQIRQLTDAATAATTAHDKVLAEKDKTIAERDAEIAKLKPQILDGAALDKLVAERSDLVAKARAVHKDVKTEGLDSAGIRKAAVTLALGDAAIKDKSDAYIEARFDGLVEDAMKKAGGEDKFRETLKSGIADTAVDDSEQAKAWADMTAELRGEKKVA